MISSRAHVQRLVRLAAAFTLLAIPLVEGAEAQPNAVNQLRRFIQANPELQAVFGRSSVDAVSPARATASADVGAARHAVVLYRQAMQGSIGEQFCRVALAAPERMQWLAQLRALPGSDEQVADLLDQARTVKTVMRQMEFHSINAPTGWRAAVCAISREDYTWVFPGWPDPASVRAASYTVAKRLFAAGQSDDALNRFRTLKADPEHYPNALLFIVAILDERNPPIAEALRRDHVRLTTVTDPDALAAYLQASAARGYLEDAQAARNRCRELASGCPAIDSGKSSQP